jgi:hypothetical protein
LLCEAVAWQIAISILSAASTALDGPNTAAPTRPATTSEESPRAIRDRRLV